MASRMGFWGWSYGGYFTLYTLEKTDLFKAGVSVAPVTDWRNYDSIYTERYMGLPSDNEEGYRKSSPVNFAARSARQPAGGARHRRRQCAPAEHDPDGQCVHQLGQAIPVDVVSAQDARHRGKAARTHLFHLIEDHFETEPCAGKVAGRQSLKRKANDM